MRLRHRIGFVGRGQNGRAFHGLHEPRLAGIPSLHDWRRRLGLLHRGIAAIEHLHHLCQAGTLVLELLRTRELLASLLAVGRQVVLGVLQLAHQVVEPAVRAVGHQGVKQAIQAVLDGRGVENDAGYLAGQLLAGNGVANGVQGRDVHVQHGLTVISQVTPDACHQAQTQHLAQLELGRQLARHAGRGLANRGRHLAAGRGALDQQLVVHRHLERLDIAQCGINGFQGRVLAAVALAVDADGKLGVFVAVLLTLNRLLDGLGRGVAIRVGGALHVDRARIDPLLQALHAAGSRLDLGALAVDALGVIANGILGAAQCILGAVHLAAVRTLLQLQRANLGLQLDALQQQRVAGCQGSHFGHADRIAVLEVHREGAVVLSDAVDGLELGRVQVPHLGVYRALGRVGQDLDLEIRPVEGVGLLAAGRGGKQVALPDHPALTLLDVAGLPGYVDVVQRHGALLHVGAGAHARGRANQDADLAAVDRIEQGQLLVIGVGLLDEADLVGRDAHGHQVVLELLVGVPAACLGRAQRLHLVAVELLQCLGHLGKGVLVVVGQGLFALGHQGVVFLEQLVVALGLGHRAIQEHQLRAAHGVELVVDALDVLAGYLQLAALFLGGVGRVNGAHVQRHLAGAVHQAQALGVALVGILDAGQAIEAVNDVAQELLLDRRRLDLDQLAVAALELWHREGLAAVVLAVPALDVLQADGIGELVVQLHQAAHVGPGAAQASHFLEPAGFGRLERGSVLHELRAPGVEVLQAHLLEGVGGQVAHHRIHLDGAVADGRAGHERDRAGRAVAQHADLVVKVVGLA